MRSFTGGKQTPGDSIRDLFIPLAGGHLTFERVT